MAKPTWLLTYNLMGAMCWLPLLLNNKSQSCLYNMTTKVLNDDEQMVHKIGWGWLISNG